VQRSLSGVASVLDEDVDELPVPDNQPLGKLSPAQSIRHVYKCGWSCFQCIMDFTLLF